MNSRARCVTRLIEHNSLSLFRTFSSPPPFPLVNYTTLDSRGLLRRVCPTWTQLLFLLHGVVSVTSANWLTLESHSVANSRHFRLGARFSLSVQPWVSFEHGLLPTHLGGQFLGDDLLMMMMFVFAWASGFSRFRYFPLFDWRVGLVCGRVSQHPVYANRSCSPLLLLFFFNSLSSMTPFPFPTKSEKNNSRLTWHSS